MSDQTSGSNLSYDIYEYLDFHPNHDGTITRKESSIPDAPATPDPASHPTLQVLSKDVPINESSNTWARIFFPRQALETKSSKLPLVVYFHGGGFVIMSAASPIFHDFCFNIALELPAVVVSIEYRLAPEHRLPAAYDDSIEAFRWINATGESWLRDHADYGSCFIAGTSAGGNLAYHAGLRIVETVDDFLPLKIKGMILHQPFFGGAKRTESELTADTKFPYQVTDLMWSLSLPIGADRDHEYSNPTVEGGSKNLDQISSMGWRVLMTGCDGDLLFDHQIRAVKFMEEKGIKVDSYFVEGGYHGVDFVESSRGKAAVLAIKSFMESTLVDA